MNQSQELKSPQDVLKPKAVQKKVPDENHELSYQNQNQQIHRGALEEAAYTAYDALESHKKFQSQQKSYNEVQKQYEEQAFSSDPVEQAAPQGAQKQIQEKQTALLQTEDDESGSGNFQQSFGIVDVSTWKSPTMEDVESAGTGGRILGTAEAPELSKNSRELLKNQELQEKLEGKRKTVQKGYSRYSMGKYSTKEKEAFRYYGRLNITGENEVKAGRLKYHLRVDRVKMNRADYEELLRRKGKRSFRRREGGRLLFHGVTIAVEDESIAEDEVSRDMKKNLRRADRLVMVTGRKSIRTLKQQNNVYARLDLAKQKEQVLRDKRERLLSDAKKKQQKEELRAAKSRAQKKKLKKQMVQMRVQEEGNFFRRARQGILVKRRAKKLRKQTRKRVLSTVFSIGGIFLFFLVIGIIIILLLISAFTGGADYYASAVTQNDYGTLSDATGYYRNLETDMDEYLNADREALEAELEADYGPDIYEYIYDLAEFGFSANTLMAYLSAVYGSFTLEDVKEELESIFEEMYTLTIDVKLEDRVVSEYNSATGEYEDITRKKKICYVTLEKKELEEVVEGRMTPDQLGQYGDYRLSTGGQQVYSPVMREDWTNLISSNFGERVHPITKERKMHNGVDIAVPVGTHIYSAVDGTVILAGYSESAGNWVKVQTETGWTVVMMHMDSLTVSEGQTVKKGDHLGYSGNTGRSTGPHLHLEVRDPSDQPMNPIFIIPQNCASIQGGDE